MVKIRGKGPPMVLSAAGRMRNGIVTFAFLALLAGAFLSPLTESATRTLIWRFDVPAPVARSGKGAPVYEEDFVSAEAVTKCVHCPTLVELDGGDLLAAWYEGTREGAEDVAVFSSRWDRGSGSWSQPRLLTDPALTQAGLGRYVRKIGNVVLGRDAGGRVWLFYVTVAAGGWSGSSINYATSADEGLTWSKPVRIVANPILNMGVLVRCAPVLYTDGAIGLPVYNECIGKYGEFMRMGPDGSVLDKSRFSWGRSSLQPSVIPMEPRWAIAYLRQSGSQHRRILRSDSSNGGRTWTAPWNTSLPNPDSAVAGLRARNGTLLLVYNSLDVDRDVLSLALSDDRGRTWRDVHQFETGHGGIVGYSYPFIIQAQDGMFHLLYSFNRERIKHVSFNDAWLRRLR